jgi:hypothetical protein
MSNTPARSTERDVVVNGGVIIGASVLLGSVWLRQPAIGAALVLSVSGAIKFSRALRKRRSLNAPTRG